MRKLTSCFICLLVLCITIFCPLSTSAIISLDVTKKASLTLNYQKDNLGFSNLLVSIFRVAEANNDGTFELISPYSSFPVNIHGIVNNEQWEKVASTLSSYIIANKLEPYKVQKTDNDGEVVFENIEVGLYLVSSVVAKNDKGTYKFNQFMVYLPTPQSDGSYIFDVNAKPKCVNFVPKEEYKVIKLWQGDNLSNRPKQVTVDIYKDGELYSTQMLNASNDWSYMWSDYDNNSKWTVIEKSVLENYSVTIEENNGTFTVINTLKNNSEVPDTPQTGDTSNVLLWIILLCVCGMMLVILGVYNRRRSE